MMGANESDQELEILEEQVRGILNDIHDCVELIDQQEAAREQLMKAYWDLIEREFPLCVGRAFQRTDAALLNAIAPSNAGSIAAVAWVVGHSALPGCTRVYCASVGDSRVILCRNGRAMPLSADHKPSDQSERERVEAHGGAGGVDRRRRRESVFSGCCTSPPTAADQVLGDDLVLRWSTVEATS